MEWGKEGYLLARTLYTMPECAIAEIGIQMHSNCWESKKGSQFLRLETSWNDLSQVLLPEAEAFCPKIFKVCETGKYPPARAPIIPY